MSFMRDTLRELTMFVDLLINYPSVNPVNGCYASLTLLCSQSLDLAMWKSGYRQRQVRQGRSQWDGPDSQQVPADVRAAVSFVSSNFCHSHHWLRGNFLSNITRYYSNNLLESTEIFLCKYRNTLAALQHQTCNRHSTSGEIYFLFVWCESRCHTCYLKDLSLGSFSFNS